MIAAVQQSEILSMEPETADDLELAERVASGDAAALEKLYERHAGTLYAFVYHCLDGDRCGAEEVWQDALNAAIRAIAAYRGQSRFFSWLCGIARNKVADHWRRRERHDKNLCVVPQADLNRLLDEGPLPDELLQRRATCKRVVEVLGELPADYRTALVARYAEGLSVEEVAQLLGRSYKAAESVLSRAKEAFRAVLANQKEIGL